MITNDKSNGVAPSSQILLDMKAVLKEYNDVRKSNYSETNKVMLERLERIAESIVEIIEDSNEDLETWSDSCRPIGNWPDLAWISFGGRNNFLTREGSMTINVNFHFAADQSGIFLVVLPFAKGWKKSLGRRWVEVFSPIKREFRKTLNWASEYGFLFDDNAVVGTFDSSGSNMKDGYIIYKFYNIDNLPDEEILKRDILIATKAQQQIVNFSEDLNRIRIWAIRIGIQDNQTEENIWNEWNEENLVYKFFPQPIDSKFSKLCKSDISKKGFVTECDKLGISSDLIERLWVFVYQLRFGDIVLAVNSRNEVIAEGRIDSPLAFFDGVSKVFKNVEWQRFDVPKVIPTDLVQEIL